ncbi:MAG: hypothetical protein NZM04_09740 [Methylacidiphilales bacterium]|nr:hypothetical protein [Candidatus Methylacidiphilales bacterium]
MRGVIAQGHAGRIGSGGPLVAVIPRGVVFRIAYSGRMYGRPREYFCLYDGSRVITATRDQRELGDLF